MSLLSTLQNLKNDKKKLIIITSIAVIAMLVVDTSIFMMLKNGNNNAKNLVTESDSLMVSKTIITEEDSTTKNISKILELFCDSTNIVVQKRSDTCEVHSKLNVDIKNLKLNLDLTYDIFPYPSKEETLRLTRLLNFRLGKLLDENSTDYISIEILQKNFNIFLRENISKTPYEFNGTVGVKLHKFNLEVAK